MFTFNENLVFQKKHLQRGLRGDIIIERSRLTDIIKWRFSKMKTQNANRQTAEQAREKALAEYRKENEKRKEREQKWVDGMKRADAFLRSQRKHETGDIITAENLQQMGTAITLRGLLTIYKQSGDEKILHIIWDCIAYAQHPERVAGGDGADLLQDTILYLWGYAGKSVHDSAGVGLTKNGDDISILRGAFRNLHRIIYGHKKRVFSTVFLTDYEDENGREIPVPALWDMPDAETLFDTQKAIEGLTLQPSQRSILSARLRGEDISTIARKKGVTRQAVQNALRKIADKWVKTYGQPENLRETLKK